MNYDGDAQGETEVEEQLQRFQQAVDDLRETLQGLKANPPKSSQDRQQKILLIHRLKQEVNSELVHDDIGHFAAVSCIVIPCEVFVSKP